MPSLHACEEQSPSSLQFFVSEHDLQNLPPQSMSLSSLLVSHTPLLHGGKDNVGATVGADVGALVRGTHMFSLQTNDEQSRFLLHVLKSEHDTQNLPPQSMSDSSRSLIPLEHMGVSLAVGPAVVGAEVGCCVGAMQVFSLQIFDAQSLLLLHALPSSQGEHKEPPQSTSLSSESRTPFSHDSAGVHTPCMHIMDKQSMFLLHVRPSTQGLQKSPPQSISDSSLSCFPFLHMGRTINVGAAVVGTFVGAAVGVSVGTAVGVSVGTAVGAMVGSCVVGASLGPIVVGARVEHFMINPGLLSICSLTFIRPNQIGRNLCGTLYAALHPSLISVARLKI